MKFWPIIKVLPVQTNLKFVRFSKLGAILSAIAVIGSLALTLYPPKPPCFGLACGIDFTGGTVLEITTAPRDVDLGKVRSSLSTLGLGEVQVQAFGAPSSAIVRFQNSEGAQAAATSDKVKARLTEALGDVRVVRTDTVGAKVSQELLSKGVMALGLAIGLMMIYIWFRFELQFGLGAVAALFHDVILTFGLIAIMRIEFNLQAIAGILTIIGYSMNDTVVVFDRLRENLRKYKRMPLAEVIDLSINEMLTRTIVTSLTAIIALIALALFGGPSLFGLAAIMLFGLIIGTYSSIYVAAPIILLWGANRKDDPAEPLPVAGARP